MAQVRDDTAPQSVITAKVGIMIDRTSIRLSRFAKLLVVPIQSAFDGNRRRLRTMEYV